MSFVIPVIFLAVLTFDFRNRQGREKVLYIALAVTAVLFGLFAGLAAKSDHVGASLSGMISIFMR